MTRNPHYSNLEKTNHNISLIIQACRAGNRAAQKRLYQLYFSYGMSIALRYSNAKTEAEEILNESFFKVYSKIDQYDEQFDFKKWFRSILINTSIDYYRKFKKLKIQITDDELAISSSSEQNLGWENLLFEDVLKEIQLLPPSYRLVFNLYAIDGYKHQDIAEQLNISVGTSRSNYARARKILQNRLEKNYGKKKISNGR